MPPRSTKDAVEEKAKASSSRGGKKKLTPYNKFMQTEMARLKEKDPDMLPKDRFQLAVTNWKTSELNPKNA